MPPLVYETVAWLRHYSCVPITALPGERERAAAPRAAYAAPIAGAVIGAVGGLILLIAATIEAPSFVAAALALLTLLLITCGRGEQALAAAVDKLSRAQAPADAAVGPPLLSYGLVAIVLAVLFRVGALDGLIAFGPWKAAFTLLGAVAVSRAATVAFALIRPVTPTADQTAETAETAAAIETPALQWVAITGIVIGIVSVTPFHGVGAAIAGLVGAIGAVAVVMSFVSRNGGQRDVFTAGAELVSEIAFLLAVLAFATRA